PFNPYIEASLYTTSASREKWDACANLYSLLVSLDALERAYISSHAVDEQRYAPQCTRLLAQIKTSVKLVTASGASAGGEGPPPVADVDEFMAVWGLNLPLTSHRLSLGIPATLEHPGGGGGGGADRAKNVAETTQAFITLMDALKLNLRAKDQLHPLLGEAVSCWNRLGGGGGQGSGDDSGLGGRREKLVGWLITLNQLRASDEIDEDQARQMLFDVEGAYQAWFRSL
ncbi:vacuolar protein sorting-associated, partial [Jaminaea rosea]